MLGFQPEDPEVEFGEIGPAGVKLLYAAMEAEGGIRLPESWVPDFTWVPFRFGDRMVGVIDEAFVGISIKGPREVVDRVAARYRESKP